MQKINFDPLYIIKSVKNRIASAKSANFERNFARAISLLDDYILLPYTIKKFHPKEYDDLIKNFYETLGDTYFSLKNYDLAFNSYLISFNQKNKKILNKILFTTKFHSSNLSSNNLLLGILFLMHSKNDFPGKDFSDAEFLKNINNLKLSMDMYFNLYLDIYISNQVIDASMIENMDRNQELLNIALIKYGSEMVTECIENFEANLLPDSLTTLLNQEIEKYYINNISTDIFTNANRKIYEEDQSTGMEDKLKRLNCNKERFWKIIDPEILHRTVTEDINLKFKYATAINSLSGHLSVKNEIKKRVGLYSSHFTPLDERRFDYIFESSIDLSKIKSVYRRLPLL
jgi:hypothetical protein